MSRTSWRDAGIFGCIVVVCLGAIVHPLWSYGAYLTGVLSSLKRQVSWVREGDLWAGRHKDKKHLIAPCELDEVSAVRELHRIATAAGMKVESIRPAPAPSGPGPWVYDELYLHVTGQGSEVALFSFMRVLVSGDHLWRLHECDLRSGSKKDTGMSGRWKIGILRHVKRAIGSQRLAFSEVFREEELLAWPSSGRTVFSAAAPLPTEEISLGAMTDALKDLALIAVIDDGSAQAAVLDRRTNRSFVVREGDAIDGMSVAEISDRAIILMESGGVTHRLSM